MDTSSTYVNAKCDMKKVWLLLPLGCIVGLWGCKKEKEAAESKPAAEVISVRVAQVTKKSLAFPVRAAGVVYSDQEARPAFKTGGIIKRIFVEEGQPVLKGTLMATLNLTEINAQVRQAEEGLEKVRRDYQRAKNLYADSIATLEQLQNATTALRLAEETLEIARFNQSYSEVRAPMDGTVLRILLHSGEVAAPGMPVFYMLGTGKGAWSVKAGLSDRDWARIRVGNPAEVYFDAFPDRSFPARVTQLSEVVNPQSGTFDVQLELERQPPRLATGLVASLMIYPPAGPESLVAPLDALIESDGQRGIVYRVRDSSVVQRVEVERGALYEHQVLIKKGLRAGDLVVTTGGAYLSHGTRIRIVQ